MWKQALYDETLLTLLRPMMTEEQQAAYLNPALGYFYDACIDALPLSGDLRLSRKFSARGDTLSVAVALPLPQNAWGYTTLTFRQEGSTTALVLNSATQTLTFSMASADGNQNAITGSIQQCTRRVRNGRKDAAGEIHHDQPAFRNAGQRRHTP